MGWEKESGSGRKIDSLFVVCFDTRLGRNSELSDWWSTVYTVSSESAFALVVHWRFHPRPWCFTLGLTLIDCCLRRVCAVVLSDAHHDSLAAVSIQVISDCARLKSFIVACRDQLSFHDHLLQHRIFDCLSVKDFWAKKTNHLFHFPIRN